MLISFWICFHLGCCREKVRLHILMASWRPHCMIAKAARTPLMLRASVLSFRAVGAGGETGLTEGRAVLKFYLRPFVSLTRRRLCDVCWRPTRDDTFSRGPTWVSSSCVKKNKTAALASADKPPPRRLRRIFQTKTWRPRCHFEATAILRQHQGE